MVEKYEQDIDSVKAEYKEYTSDIAAVSQLMDEYVSMADRAMSLMNKASHGSADSLPLKEFVQSIVEKTKTFLDRQGEGLAAKVVKAEEKLEESKKMLSPWIVDYLSNHPQYVRTRDCVSGTVLCSVGAPRGTVLALFLFTLYTADFSHLSPTCHLQQFSDDSAIVGFITDGDDRSNRGLVQDFVDWCQQNLLLINAGKTKELVVDFRRRPYSSPSPVKIQGRDIEYLGVHLNNKLDWTHNTTALYKKGQTGAMGAPRELQWLLGVLASMLVIMSFYQWDVSQRKQEMIKQVQNQRKQLLREACAHDKGAYAKGLHSLDRFTGKELGNLIVDDKHGIIYCYIPKVACTNWKRVMLFLKQNKSYDELLAIPGHSIHASKNLTLLSRLPKAEIKTKLKHYTKFMFVRDPFVRLISAYRDKFLHPNKYYKIFVQRVLSLYGDKRRSYHAAGKGKRKVVASRTIPSFYNFIQYLLDPQTERNHPYDPHWRQMYRLCYPCAIQYDFIGHQETLQEDAEQLFKILKLQDDVKIPPSYDNVTTSGSVEDWFETVPLEARRKLYKIYERDFRLFGYERPVELLDG
ncbi:carbohydrate sulfotransferase 12-like [Chaetodon trifascialis]|uniref:carbohydrate sulfotransferase 12-like n=1 Tax=Chaetodon trifascialis TaxID=109706 RepID=UPI003994B31C